MAIPVSAVRAHYQRVAILRLMQSREIALERQLAATIAYAGRQAAGHYHFNRAADGLDFRRSLAIVLRPSLRETARTFGAQIGEKGVAMGLERKLFDDLDADTAAYIDDHTASRVVQISDAMRAQIAEIVRQGLEQGWGNEQIASAIEEAFAGEMSLHRARRIARTETHTAAMVGQFGAAQASGIEWRKTWLATDDTRTRSGHVEANGQERALMEPFSVRPDVEDDGGFEDLMFPGDPEGSAASIINCRCVCTFDPVGA